MNKKIKFFIYLTQFILLTTFVSYILIKNDAGTNIRIVYNRTLIINKLLSPNEVEGQRKIRIFCFILTSSNNYMGTKAKIIYQTWAHKCDTYKFVSVVPDHIRAMNESEFKSYQNGTEYNYGFDILHPPGLINDTYGKLTDKVYLTMKHLYNKYNDYDWYLKADDDTFIFVDNLRYFVADKNASSPVTYGYDFKVIVEGGYHSGGGGYLLSNEALSRIGSKLNEDYTFCPNTGTEDVDVAKCFRKLGVYPNKSLDEEGKERFHPLSITGHYYGEFPDWLYQYASNPVQKVIYQKNICFG